MKRAALHYELPDALIAVRPAERRDGARLLVLGQELRDATVAELPELIPEGALVVVNDTRVRRARIFGAKRGSGGRVELLFLRRLYADADADGELWEAIGRSSKPLKVGTVIDWGDDVSVELIGRDSEATLTVRVRANREFEQILNEQGHLPLPPYMRRGDEIDDLERYQTVYARRTASAAAPTAGLHLSQALLARLRERQVEVASLELEIGLGTFRSVLVDDLDEHPMHAETIDVGVELVASVARARERNAPVIAVGTTVVRALESAADPAVRGLLRPTRGETRLLIQPGYDFRVVDALLTNFHVPESTLLALVSAFAGYERTMGAYRHAVNERYRFLSYGDAMWIPRKNQ